MIRKVLFVEDDQIMRAAIEQRLERHSQQFHLVTAVDGFDAVGKLKHYPFSLVVVDLVMPRMDGVSLIDHLKQNYPDLPIIIASGIGEEKVAEAARSSAARRRAPALVAKRSKRTLLNPSRSMKW